MDKSKNNKSTCRFTIFTSHHTFLNEFCVPCENFNIFHNGAYIFYYAIFAFRIYNLISFIISQTFHFGLKNFSIQWWAQCSEMGQLQIQVDLTMWLRKTEKKLIFILNELYILTAIKIRKKNKFLYQPLKIKNLF